MYSLLLQVQPPNPAGINSNINPLFSIKRSISSTSAAVRAALVAGTTTCCAHDLCKKGVDPVTDFHVQQVIERQLKHRDVIATRRTGSHFDPGFLREAYQRCQRLCAAYAKNFYLGKAFFLGGRGVPLLFLAVLFVPLLQCLSSSNYAGTLLMTDERKKAIWALYVWCRRTDDLVDGPNAHLASSTLLDIWEERLEEIFNGCPYDILDSALADTVQRFPLDIKPFKDMIEGMRMDTCKDRYENFVELYHYCYYVAGTAGLMSVPIMAKSPESLTHAQSIYHTALALRGRIYLPQDELREFGLKDKDVFSRKVTHKWREFMKKQIMRARAYFDQAEQDATQLDSDSRWPAWSSLMLYRRILKEIENNDYDNLTKQAHVGTPKKLLTLLLAYTKAVPNLVITGTSDVKVLFPVKRLVTSTAATVRAELVTGTSTSPSTSSHLHGLSKKGIDPLADFHVHQVIERQSKPKDVVVTLRLIKGAKKYVLHMPRPSIWVGTLLMTDERKKAIDMIEGMRMDTCKYRYDNFEKLYRYCYCVAGTVGLMSVPIMGIPPESVTSSPSIYHDAVCLGIGNQLTNILRDVREDALRWRIYLPRDKLREFGANDKDVFSGKVTDKWREFMKKQIKRARAYFEQAEQGVTKLDQDSQWPVWSSLMLYQGILNEIENNDYDNLTKPAYVGRTKKLLTLPLAYGKAMVQCQPQPFSARR
ncbi:hypothetical protein Cgig2_016904 [Carnegiea gigantea]|uniref:15-cis-phytoene synthase n=1 Tax=Carnegiea gigantea TaxID=171969 RepID=A0A9Q1QD62_9CARY|nr:hypothetical protein Cgig2_016904 [Carnegiea gigantea]